MKKYAALLFFIFSVTVSVAQSAEGDYRSKQSGNWNEPSNWERFDGNDWITANEYPSVDSSSISILDGDSIALNISIAIDQVTVEHGGILAFITGNVANGPGVDLKVFGKVIHNNGTHGDCSTYEICSGGVYQLINGFFNCITFKIMQGGSLDFDGFTTMNSTTINNLGIINLNGTPYDNDDILAEGGVVSTNATLIINNEIGGVINKNKINSFYISNEGIPGLRFHQRGALNINAGKFYDQAGTENSGNINIAAGVTYHARSKLEFKAGTSITGNGTFYIEGTNSEPEDGVVVNTGSSFTFPGSVDLVIGTGSLTGSDPFVLEDSMRWIGGRIQFPNGFKTGAAGVITIKHIEPYTNNGSPQLFGTTLENNGTINWLEKNFGFVSGSIVNKGIFNMQTDAAVVHAEGDNTSFVNYGTFNKLSSGVFDMVAPFTNKTGGLLNINAGTWRNLNSLTNAGAIHLETGTRLYSQNRFELLAGASFSGPGQIFINGESFLCNTGHPFIIPLSIDFILAAGILTGNDKVILQDDMSWIGGRIDLPNGFQIDATGVLTLQQQEGFGGSLQLFNTTIENNGTIRWLARQLGFFSGKIINNGLFSIQTGDFFTTADGDNSSITNNGIFEKRSGSVSDMPISFTNSSNGMIKGVGTLALNIVVNNGKIAPGFSPGIFTLNSNSPVLTANSKLEIELVDGSGPGTGHDQLLYNGNLMLQGTLVVTETPGVVPTGQYEILKLSNGNLTGNFSATQLPAGYSVATSGNSVIVTKSGVPEICNGIDDDGDGDVDEGFQQTTWYRDSDADGFGSNEDTLHRCFAPAGYIAQGGDCDDANVAFHPGATEICDGFDNNCDGNIDEGVSTTFYRDADGDGFGNPAINIQACVVPGGYVANSNDCDDTPGSGASINPNTIWYLDADNDNYYTGAGITQCISPGAGYKTTGLTAGGDCNDANAAVHPAATEICNGIDDNCNGQTDEGVTITFYRDADGDGFGNPAITVQACTAPGGYVANSLDCNDTPGSGAVINPNTIWYLDADNDNYYTGTGIMQCVSPGTGYKMAGLIAGGDCNDGNAMIYPGAAELCDGIDNDCDGEIDENITTQTWYRDADNDGYGNSTITLQSCSQPAGYVLLNGDCNDANAAIHPGATEICNGIDDNCNGQIDEGVTTTFYRDADNDGFGNPALPVQACSAPAGYVANQTDCNDANAAVHPGATEICNGIDDNCNGQTDEDVTTTFYQDADGDGFGNPAITIQACAAPAGYVSNNTDCNDTPGSGTSINPNTVWYLDADNDNYYTGAGITQCISPGTGYKITGLIAGSDCNDANASIHPGATEICNGIDDNCNGQTDEGVTTTFYRDADNDGFGNPALPVEGCSAPAGYVANQTDCNDANAAIYPGATEICNNNIDDNCNGQVDEGCVVSATSEPWTWVSGSNLTGQAGVYGTINFPAPANRPGAREGAVSWTDKWGNFWLLGGYGDANSQSGGLLNDLWKYNTSTSQWTWLAGSNTANQPGVYGTLGVASFNNTPGAREGAVSWSDASGNLWLMGGRGYARASSGYGYLNDLWRFNPQTSIWTWIGGSSLANPAGSYGVQGVAAPGNIPPGLFEASGSTDPAGNFWLMGGGYNDLWKYNPATNQWAWMKGSKAANQFGVYGTRGMAAPANMPGGRIGGISWIDSSGNFWLMGGSGSAENTGGYLNDLWKYNPASNQWAWVSGSKMPGQPGVYGTPGLAEPNNTPGARSEGISWMDPSGNLCLMGGNGYASNQSSGFLNDVWKFNPVTSQWAWVSGSNSINQPGIYGTKGIASTSNVAGARWQGVSWIDLAGNLWLMGGSGFASNGSGTMNDVWKFGSSIRYFKDNDQDGFGDPNNFLSAVLAPAGYVSNNGDCNDNDAGIHPDVTEICDGIDNNCDGQIDEGVSQTFYKDADGDAYGDPAIIIKACSQPSGYVLLSGDCNDANNAIYPGAPEVCGNNIDDDCDGMIDEECNPQTTFPWTWINGSNMRNQPGVYGTQGVAAAGNTPGARSEAVSWTDASGNFWLMGGEGFVGNTVVYLNDLWKYDPSADQWTWMKGSNIPNQNSVSAQIGVGAAANTPGSRKGAVGWTDASGNLWLMGGQQLSGNQIQYVNDLWKYNIAANQWTAVSGGGTAVYTSTSLALIRPGARSDAVGWTDASGNLWLMGGYGFGKAGSGSGYLNDLWKYTPATNLWKWIKGADSPDQPGVYGAQGEATTTNTPGGRHGAVSWMDASGNFWLMGGRGHGSQFGLTELNDLWKYDPLANQWTWMKGNAGPGTPAVYGTPGTPAEANTPGASWQSISWADKSGDLWLMGGAGYDDLWKYNPSINQWAWIRGSRLSNQPAVYGTKGVPAASNTPGVRYASVSWIDPAGNLWLMGGDGFLNDLWKFGSPNRYFKDNDQDGFGDPNNFVDIAQPPAGYMSDSRDCDDSKATVHPGATEICDGIDNNCNGLIDEGVSTTYYRDADGDGFGNPAVTIQACGIPPVGYVVDNTDCNDNKATVHPGATEICNNNIDDDCDGIADEGCTVFPWTWINGSNIPNQPGVYGTQGVAAAGNTPGARSEAVSWTDASGNFWLMGGEGYANAQFGYLNDLWKYDPSADQWTWMKGSNIPNQNGVSAQTGVGAAANTPGARKGAVGWTDASGNLWLMGGERAGQTPYLSDLWKYNIAANQWIVVSGGGTAVYTSTSLALIRPGGRYDALGWTDASGNLWLMGGYGLGKAGSGSGYLNDLWKYTPATNLWKWIKGGDSPDQPGVYGAQEEAATTNTPGGRRGAVSWMDASGNFWLMGGLGHSIQVGAQLLNDLWKYDPLTNQWTWMKGGNGTSPAVYGTPGTPAAANTPGASWQAISWTDKSGDFWLMGGVGYDDLWKYNPSINQWAWIRGSRLSNQPAVYGTKGVPAASNTPGTRSASVSWIDPAGNLWLMGGDGFLNDLWKFGSPNRYFKDNDQDGFGDPNTFVYAAQAPAGYVSNSGDCNDNDAAIHPGAAEICNGIDDNCDGQIDEGVTTTFYRDADGDGFGNPSITFQACASPAGYVSNNTDCNDTPGIGASINPNTIWYLDADNDNYYTGAGINQCVSPGAGYRTGSLIAGGDCNDANSAIHPGATEICNGIDDNCNGQTDEGVVVIYYQDLDADGFGNPAVSVISCNPPAGYVLNNTDNCPYIYNPGQEDSNHNGIGDACENSSCEDVIPALNEVEPNNTIAAAAPVCGADFFVSGVINPGGDLDHYPIPVSSNENLIYLLIDGSQSPASDYVLSLLNSSGTQLAVNDESNSTLYGVHGSALTLGSLSPGTYYAKVRLFSQSQTSLKYTLYSMARSTGSAVEETALPNDVPAQAQTNAVNLFSGMISGSTDQDFYSFAVAAGAFYYMAASNTNVSLQLIGPDGVTVLLSSSGVPHLIHKFAATGTYYIKVSGTAGSAYTLSMAKPYTQEIPNGIDDNCNGLIDENCTSSANASLSNLVLSQGILAPAFASATTGYTATVASSVASITVTPTASDAGATIKVNNTTVVSGNAYGPITLITGSNIISIVVTAPDGVTIKTYAVTVTKSPGTICESAIAQAYKSSLNTGNQAHRGELGLEFTVTNPAGIMVKQLGAFDDKADGIVGLQPGAGVRVAIFNMATHTIVSGLDATITGLADAYTGNHRMKNITPVTLAPGNYMIVAKGYGSDERNGNLGNGGGPYPAGDDGSGAISFKDEAAYGPDDPNGFNYPTVAGNFGSNHQFLAGTFSFTTAVSCAVASANLSNLTLSQGILSPAFASATTSYSASVANGINSIKITPTATDVAASIKINGNTVVSGNPSPEIALAEGINIINVVVTASDGITVKTYSITVTRAASGNCQSPQAQAYVANTSAGNQGHQGELGMEFIVNNPGGIVISQLGAFDDGGNGITGTQSGGIRVAVFNRSTHTIVQGLNTIITGLADAYSGNHRMKNITPVVLPQGDYVIVAKGYNITERNGNIFNGGGPFADGDNGGGAIGFGGQSSYGPDDPAGFSYPAIEGNFGTNHVFLAGSFAFTTVIPCGGGTCESPSSQAYSAANATGTQAYRGELGMEFIVNNPAGIIVKQLGAFDHDGNGITGTQAGGSVRVAIFNRATHTIVTGLDANISGLADAYAGFHRLKNVAPVVLPPGDYTIVAKGYGPAELNGNIFSGSAFPAGDNASGAISFGSLGSYGVDDPNGFSYPSTEGNFGSTHVFGAGTFSYTVNLSCPPANNNLVTNASNGNLKTVAVTNALPATVRLYPNPASGLVNLQFTNIASSKISIEIMSSDGRVIAQKTLNASGKAGLLNTSFNLYPYPAGIYFVKIKTTEGVKTEKLVIQR